MSAWLRRYYGAGPVHLVAIVVGGLVGVYAGIKLVGADPRGVLVWLIGGALLHDLVLVPAYSALDRAARSPLGGVPAWYDHVRVPTLLSGLLLLVFFPLIARLPADKFESTTGTSIDVYLGRYLALVAAMFALSGLAWIVRVALRSRRPVRSRSPVSPPSGAPAASRAPLERRPEKR